jgi:hypothetical protein
MEKRYELFASVLRELHNQGVLDNIVLAGSWCQYFYRIFFKEAPEIPLIRTTDIDFLIPNPPKIKKHVDVAATLNRLGFDNDFDYHTGLVKFVHPDLEIQFITPALGRGKEAPYNIKEYNINAEGLRYLTPLQDFKFNIKHNGIQVWLPEPEAYILQKILVSLKRKDKAKKNKDLMAAKSIGELCLQHSDRRTRLKVIFQSLPNKWQKSILNVLRKLSKDLFDFLVSVHE